jgi:hypothetical protein
MNEMVHEGINKNRTSIRAGNPDEFGFSSAWKGIASETLGYLLCGQDKSNHEYSQRDATVAATIIQWLGSPVGSEFVNRVSQNFKRTAGCALITAERQRQIYKEGYSEAHDDEHEDGSLALAGALYATPITLYEKIECANGFSFGDAWPWETTCDKRAVVDHGNVIKANRLLPVKQRIRLLAMAGALIAAEIDRLQRLK